MEELNAKTTLRNQSTFRNMPQLHFCFYSTHVTMIVHGLDFCPGLLRFSETITIWTRRNIFHVKAKAICSPCSFAVLRFFIPWDSIIPLVRLCRLPVYDTYFFLPSIFFRCGNIFQVPITEQGLSDARWFCQCRTFDTIQNNCSLHSFIYFMPFAFLAPECIFHHFWPPQH